MKNIPPLGPLISFHAAATHQSFTAAARELNLTHGAVSRAVKQLEEFFGTQLFHRRNRGIYLTEKGSFFARHVEKILKELERYDKKYQMVWLSSLLNSAKARINKIRDVYGMVQ